MGKAAKQNANRMAKRIDRANRMAKEVQENKEDKDFLQMIEAMQDDKMYRIKKGDKYLFDGINAPGEYWKSQFLTKKEEGYGQEQN